MPVAFVLGGDPAYRLAVGSPLTTTLDPLMLSGLFRGQPVELVKCRSHDLAVPADADLVIEGTSIPPGRQPLPGRSDRTAGCITACREKPPVVRSAGRHRADQSNLQCDCGG